MTGSAWLRLAAFGFVLAAIALGVLAWQRPPAPLPDLAAAPPPPFRPSTDGLSAALARCQALGAAGAEDPACLAAWGESRRRFLGLAASTEPGRAP